MNPFDAIEVSKQTKLQALIDKELSFTNMSRHVMLRWISVRGPLEEVMQFHALANQAQWKVIGSRKELDKIKDKVVEFATIWYDFDLRQSVPDDLSLCD